MLSFQVECCFVQIHFWPEFERISLSRLLCRGKSNLYPTPTFTPPSPTVELCKLREIQKVPDAWKTASIAGTDWYHGFKMRHPVLALRKPERLSCNRAQAFNKERVDNYFDALKKLLPSDVDPRLVYNIDETGLSSVPNVPRKVLAQKGQRAVNSIAVNERGTLTTVIPCISASGELLRPFVIFKGKRKDAAMQDALKNAEMTAEMTDSGYVDRQTFLKFLTFFQKNRPMPEKTCYLVLDGHGSHCSYEALSFCIENKIELICIPPHTSHRLQPLDTHWNGPLKKLWAELVHELLCEKDTVSISRFDFIQLLNKVWSIISKKRDIIINGFQYCGIYPTQNTIHETDFHINKSFVDQNTQPTRPSRSNCSTEKSVFPSPNKTLSDVHKKPHLTQLCSPENVRAKQLKSKSTPQPSSSPVPCSSLSFKNPTMKKTSQVSKKYRMPSWMKASGSESNDQDENKCHVCGQMWSKNTVLDFFRCITCARWACEDCSEVERCFHCV